MRFSVDQKSLKQAARLTKLVVSNRIFQPAQQCVLIEAREGKLTLTASDLEFRQVKVNLAAEVEVRSRLIEGEFPTSYVRRRAGLAWELVNGLCWRCGGEGRVLSGTCRSCKGTGKRDNRNRLNWARKWAG